MASGSGTGTGVGGPILDLVRPALVTFGLIVAVLLLVGPDRWEPGLKVVAANLLAFAFGALVGATELVSRYRDDPASALRTTPARLYMLLNAIVAWGAFWLIHSGRVPVPVRIFDGHPLLNALIIGGFGGMALFRTSIFNVQIRDQTVPIGPEAVLRVILRAADRACDRERAAPRAEQVRAIMDGVTFERARITLPQYCYVLLQNVGAEERGDFDQSVLALEKQTSMSDETKAYNLGLLLMNMVGHEVLRRAVQGLGDRIKGPSPDDPPILGQASKIKLADLAAIRELCAALRPGTASANTSPLRPLADLLTFDSSVTDDKAKVVIALARLRGDFGPETVALAIGSHRAATEPTAPAGPPPPPQGGAPPPGTPPPGTPPTGTPPPATPPTGMPRIVTEATLPSEFGG